MWWVIGGVSAAVVVGAACFVVVTRGASKVTRQVLSGDLPHEFSQDAQDPRP